MPLKNRLIRNVKINSQGCWIWQGSKSQNGYGFTSVGSRSDKTRRTVNAHRLSYEVYKGDIKPGMQIDHLCKVRACINPNHLESVTPRENINRSNAYYRVEAAKTHCPQGHEYTKENLYTAMNKSGGTSRSCRTCSRERSKQRYWLTKVVAA